MANRNRKHKITLYLSDDEMYILKNKAQLSNLGSMSAYLINQIAKRANATGNLYLEDMKEVKELMEKIWHTHESMLSRQPLISRSLHLQSG